MTQGFYCKVNCTFEGGTADIKLVRGYESCVVSVVSPALEPPQPPLVPQVGHLSHYANNSLLSLHSFDSVWYDSRR